MTAVTPSAGLDLAAYLAAVGLAAVAAWFSVRGMVVLFPGARLSMVAMAVAMGSRETDDDGSPVDGA